MPFIKKIDARVYARATELSERVTTAILGIFPEEVRENVSITEETVEGQVGDQILIISGVLDNKHECEMSFDFMLRHMDKRNRRSIKRTLDLRLNKNCILFLRIDKQGAYLGKIRLADDADVIRVKIYFKDTPRCKPRDAISLIEERLQDAEE